MHTGERIDLIVAPPGSGKRFAIRTWLDSAGDAADQKWLDMDWPDAIEMVPHFVLMTHHPVSESFAERIADGTVRVTTEEDSAGRRPAEGVVWRPASFQPIG